MALLSETLSLWEIGFRWAGQDPDRLWLRLPLPVRDNFRTLTEAILGLHLSCLTLSTEKRAPESDAPPEYFIRHHLDAVHACIDGRRFSRKLLRWAAIDRWDMYLWCERQGVPLPEFWFPPGWKLSYEWPEEPQLYDLHGVPIKPSGPVVADATQPADMPDPDRAQSEAAETSESSQGGEQKLRHNQRARIACQVVADSLWKRGRETTIAAMVKHEVIQTYCGGSHYDEETVRDWIKVVAPDAVRRKRGRPRKQNPLDDE